MVGGESNEKEGRKGESVGPRYGRDPDRRKVFASWTGVRVQRGEKKRRERKNKNKRKGRRERERSVRKKNVIATMKIRNKKEETKNKKQEGQNRKKK